MPIAKGRRARWRHWLVDGVWDTDPRGEPRGFRFLIHSVRTVQLVFGGFRRDECALHASSLTFMTLMSLVPVLALALAIAKGFGAGDVVERNTRAAIHQRILALSPALADAEARVGAKEETGAVPAASRPRATDADDAAGAPAASPAEIRPPADAEADAPPRPPAVENVDETGAAAVVEAEVDVAKGENLERAAGAEVETQEMGDLAEQVDRVMALIFSYAENISFTALGGAGLALLVWTVISVLGSVEASFNRVWGIAQGRGLLRKFTDYLSVIVILPFLVIATTSLPIADLMMQTLPGWAGDRAVYLLAWGPVKDVLIVLLAALGFTVFLMAMPNTKVWPLAGFVGGIVAALLFLFWLWACVRLQIGAVRLGKIYGSFAVLPLLLLWVYGSWQIVLLAAEVAFAIQNSGTYRKEQNAARASMESRALLALNLVAEAAERMMAGTGPFDAYAYGREKHIPVRLLHEVLEDLVQAGFLIEGGEHTGKFALLRAPDRVELRQVVDSLMRSGAKPEELGLQRLNPDIERALRALREGGEPGGEPSTFRQLASPG